MPSTAHTCICASEESWHEIPAKEWRAHQAELEDMTIALETARSVLRDNPESASEDPAFIHPESLLVDLLAYPRSRYGQTTSLPHSGPSLSMLTKRPSPDHSTTFSRPPDNMATDASQSSHYFVPGGLRHSPDPTMEVEPPSGHSPSLESLANPSTLSQYESFVNSPNPSAPSQSNYGSVLHAVPDAPQYDTSTMQQPQGIQMPAYNASMMMQMPAYNASTMMQMPAYNASTMMPTQQQQWMAAYNANTMAQMQQPQNNLWPQAQAHGQYWWPQGQSNWAQMGNHHQQAAGFDSSQAWTPSALQTGGNQQFVPSQWDPSTPRAMDNHQQTQQAAGFGSPQSPPIGNHHPQAAGFGAPSPQAWTLSTPQVGGNQQSGSSQEWDPSALRTMDNHQQTQQAVGFGFLQSPSGPRSGLPHLDFTNMPPMQAATNRRVEENLDDRDQVINGLAQTAHDHVQMQNVIGQSHQADLAKLKEDNEKVLRSQKAKGQNESRVAAVVARGSRPGSAPTRPDSAPTRPGPAQTGRLAQTASSSRYAPYRSAEAQAARDRTLLRNAKREMANDADVLLVPQEHLVDPDSSKDEETLDEQDLQQAAYAWVLGKMKNEERKKKSKSKAPLASRNKLEIARQEEQERLACHEDKLYKSMARAVFGGATGLYSAKAFKDYNPVTLDTVKLCAAGKIPHHQRGSVLLRQKYTNCLWNRLLLARLVEETLVLRASDDRKFGHLPDVSKDYLQALHFNVLKGAYEEWRRHQTRGGETAADVKARVEEDEEDRRLEVEGNSRKARKNMRRLKVAKKMRNLRLSQGDAQTARLFAQAIEVTEALGNEGMSSEDDTVRTTFTKAGEKKKNTVFVIRRQYWRAAIATKYMRMDSESAAPSKLVRNLYDDEWIKTQKSIDNEFEETLGIRKRTFKLVDFHFNGFSPEEDWVPGRTMFSESYRPTNRRIVLSNNPESTSENPPSVDPQSLLVDMQQSIGHLPKAPTRKKQVAPVKRAQRVFDALTLDIDRAVQSLQSHTSRDPQRLSDKVDKTRDVVSMVTLSLQDHKDSPQKDLIVVQLRNLERELEQFQRDLPPDPRPLSYDSAYAFSNPVQDLHFMAQLMVIFTLVCKHILNLGQKPVNFILDYVTFIVKLAFAVNSAPTTAPDDNSFGAVQDDILQQLPTSLYDSMQQLNLDGKTVLYAVCPSCHTFTPPPSIETLIEESCINAMKWKPTPPDDFIDHPLHAQFMQGFEGPVKDVLFINREGRLPIVLSASVDYYPPRGSTIHSSSASIGVMKVSCENLPVHERNEPENVYVAILPGPKAPKGEHINPYLRPVIDIAVAGWERGIHISRRRNTLRDVLWTLPYPCRSMTRWLPARSRAWLTTIIPFIAPAASVVAVPPREDWRDADTIAERKAIYREHGVHWSEMWRLPYWDPTRMLVPDPMHVVLEGVVHYHCRRVLQIDLTLACKRDPAPVAFEMDWLPITPATMARAPAKVVPKLEGDQKKVASVQRLLQRELDDPDLTANLDEDEAGTDEEDDNGSDDSDDESDEEMPRAARRAKHVSTPNYSPPTN
ncbi:hypothetical protein K438DRAFT_1973726 [Mycena galopus ATCC 62051]|nr:hypothetical protein K438DRAFT_1973726 [Mycena galopus ATCC 62051]